MTQIVNIMFGLFVVALLSGTGLMVLQREQSEIKAAQEAGQTVEDQVPEAAGTADVPVTEPAAAKGEEAESDEAAPDAEPSGEPVDKATESEAEMPPAAVTSSDGETAPSGADAAQSEEGLTIEVGEPPAGEDGQAGEPAEDVSGIESGDPPALYDTMPAQDEAETDQGAAADTVGKPVTDETATKDSTTP